MVSFCSLLENMKKQYSDNDVSEKSISVIKTGIGVDKNFWENFLKVINNSSGLSELLDVPSDKIAKWHNRIKEALEDVNKEVSDIGKNKKLI